MTIVLTPIAMLVRKPNSVLFNLALKIL